MNELRAAIEKLLARRDDIVVDYPDAGRMQLKAERPRGQVSRELRLVATDATDWRYSGRWATYWSSQPDDNCEGAVLGNLTDVLRVVQQFFIEKRHWRDVELRPQ